MDSSCTTWARSESEIRFCESRGRSTAPNESMCKRIRQSEPRSSATFRCLRGAGLQVVRHHHERWDGNGYPDRLRGDETPLSARVFALADTLDAMTSDRPYRRAVGWDGAVKEIVAQSGRQFDPEVVRVFAAREGELRRIYDDLSLVA